jgi:ribosomal protein S15
LGDPVRGITTPFIESFDTAQPVSKAPTSTKSTKKSTPEVSAGAPVHADTDTDNHLNFFLTKEELAKGIERSRWLTMPMEPEEGTSKDAWKTGEGVGTFELSPRTRDGIRDLMNTITPQNRDDGSYESDAFGDTKMTPEERQQRAKSEHETAQEALQRITSLSLSSGKDRLRINTQRCIDVFGRHNTDSTLPAKPKASVSPSQDQLEKAPRVGPDTGSSEVQVAILTAKIRSLADLLETRGRTDKHGKRDLRLLVHRRAKMLKYLRRKERGGPRWQHLIETLGLTEGTWQGEITM